MKLKIVGLAVAVASGLIPAAFAQYGYNGTGKCTVEVEVDRAADVLVTGTQAQIRSLGGRASVIRTNCNAPMPGAPVGFRFQGIDGRGRQTLVADPASNRGTAVVRIEDPRNGRERYTFDLIWDANGSYNTGIYNDGAYGAGAVDGVYNNGAYDNGAYGYQNNSYPANGYPATTGYPAYGNSYPNGGYPVYAAPAPIYTTPYAVVPGPVYRPVPRRRHHDADGGHYNGRR